VPLKEETTSSGWKPQVSLNRRRHILCPLILSDLNKLGPFSLAAPVRTLKTIALHMKSGAGEAEYAAGNRSQYLRGKAGPLWTQMKTRPVIYRALRRGLAVRLEYALRVTEHAGGTCY